MPIYKTCSQVKELLTTVLFPEDIGILPKLIQAISAKCAICIILEKEGYKKLKYLQFGEKDLRGNRLAVRRRDIRACSARLEDLRKTFRELATILDIGTASLLLNDAINSLPHDILNHIYSYIGPARLTLFDWLPDMQRYIALHCIECPIRHPHHVKHNSPKLKKFDSSVKPNSVLAVIGRRNTGMTIHEDTLGSRRKGFMTLGRSWTFPSSPTPYDTQLPLPHSRSDLSADHS